MKQIRLFLLTLLSFMVSGMALADDKPIPVEQLPQTAKTFVSQNFKGTKIVSAEKDWDSFECHLANGTEIEFTKKGIWKKIDCHSQAVPSALIPKAIQNYVKANYAECLITKIEKERNKYEIELSNDLDLTFDSTGKLIKIDD